MKTSEHTMTVRDDQGREITCDVLFTYDDDVTGKSYVVYTDNSTDEFGNVQVYASIIADNDRLDPIETPEEWRVIEAILDHLQKVVRDGEDKGMTEDEMMRAVYDEFSSVS